MRKERQAAMETLNIATGRVALLEEISRLGELLTANGNISAFDFAYGLGKIRDKVLTEEKAAWLDLDSAYYQSAVASRK